MNTTSITSLSVLALASQVSAQALNTYTRATTRTLAQISEASAVAFNPDTGTLFSIGDEGQAIFEYSKTGDLLGSMEISNLADSSGQKALVDPEGLAYLGNGKFMIGDERPMTGLITSFAAGTTIVARDLPVYLFDITYAGNSNTGLEGVCYDPVNNSVWGVKEHSPFAVYQMKDIGLPTQNVTKPFAAREFNKLGYLTDVADVFVMANSPHFAAEDPRRMNLLILSQQDNLILEITRTGQVVDQLNIAFIGAHTIEGITMDGAGVIYLVSEQAVGNTQSALHILTPPLPPTPFETWGSTMGLAGDDALPDADPDHDGKTNLSEYAFGGNPGLSDAANQAPTLQATPSGLTWSYIRRVDDPTLQFIHSRSSDLIEWAEFTPAGASIVPLETSPGFSTVSLPVVQGSPEAQLFFKTEAALSAPTP